MLLIEEGVFFGEFPRHVRRMLPLKRERYMKRHGHLLRTFRFRIDSGKLFCPVEALPLRTLWCNEQMGAQGWSYRKVTWGPWMQRGHTQFLFEREADAMAFVMRWG